MSEKQRLSTEELREIRERCEKATQGPWVVDGTNAVVWGPDAQIIFVLDANGDPDNDEFAAHAREDIPRLLDEIETLRAERDSIRELNAFHVSEINRLNALLAEVGKYIGYMTSGVDYFDVEQTDCDAVSSLAVRICNEVGIE